MQISESSTQIQLNFNQLSPTKVSGRKLSGVWGDIRANDSSEYRRADSGTRVRAQDGHHHRSIFGFAAGGGSGDRRRLEPLISAASLDQKVRMAARALARAPPQLLADDRAVIQRVGTVGVALHNHAGAEHHSKRDAREDEADKFQSGAICHRSPQ